MASCDAPGLMPISEAKAIIASQITSVLQNTNSSKTTTSNVNADEQCELQHLVDRVLAQDVVSPINVPAYDNSAMDGYAFSYDTAKSNEPMTLVGKSFAGDAFKGAVQAGECVRIMTGAELPQGVDTVVMQEETSSAENKQAVQISLLSPDKVEHGANIRRAGSDIAKGEKVFSKGHKISPIDIGLLASLGVSEARVYPQITVAVFSTGDELLAPGQPARNDRIFDSNRPMLVAMLQRLGANVIDMGIIPDDKETIRRAFEEANQRADCVITSGGVSVGEADYTREVLEEYGDIGFWKLAIKPGKPLAFGRLPNSFFFGLPGNPVSAAVTLDQIAAPALRLLAGEVMANEGSLDNTSDTKPLILKAIATERIRKRPGRTDYQRLECYIDDDGELKLRSAGSQSSGVLSSFGRSNCYAVLEQARGNVEVGEAVDVLLFGPLIK